MVSHSRSALASRGEPSGYSGSAPMLVRIFHERAHLVPSARLGITATPGTSGRLKAPSELPTLRKVNAEVMQTSALTLRNVGSSDGAFSLPDVPGVAVIPNLAEGTK